ncbi:nucleotide-binding protein [Pseudidiomarina sp. 1ASP75-14]|uniref:nucleotide-binding protein n=1 Tax=Pseudidiomarina terrestris TaxID=2820060 RepID=UPI00264CA3E1|nr:nucleotide-binding protein [Pseudidiomarina sp. 1ASP75-14]MDN7137594.1 nucleotide-binding protein [Pseudidiomarina sp. 1ASP75-14]
MARKKKPTSEDKKPLELAAPREKAKEKLQVRIDQGKTLRSKSINNQQELDSEEKAYEKWDSFNNELLRRLFTSDELYEEYSSWAGGGIVVGGRHFAEKVSDHFNEIDEKVHRLDSIIERLELIPESVSIDSSIVNKIKPAVPLDKSKIFVVHGHDSEAKLEVARFIERIGFTPIILHEQASGSKTIIEKIESYSDVGFGIVIYTPCDVGKKNSEEASFQGRARQNVVFEHGFLIGKLGRSRVCSLVKGDVETPNDISGVVYTPMDGGNWKIELAKELRAAEYPVDMNKVI